MPVLFFRPTSVYREYRCRTTLIPRSQRERIVFLNKVIEKKLSTLIYTDLTDFLAKPIIIFIVLSTHIENYSSSDKQGVCSQCGTAVITNS